MFCIVGLLLNLHQLLSSIPPFFFTNPSCNLPSVNIYAHSRVTAPLFGFVLLLLVGISIEVSIYLLHQHYVALKRCSLKKC